MSFRFFLTQLIAKENTVCFSRLFYSQDTENTVYNPQETAREKTLCCLLFSFVWSPKDLFFSSEVITSIQNCVGKFFVAKYEKKASAFPFLFTYRWIIYHFPEVSSIAFHFSFIVLLRKQITKLYSFMKSFHKAS